MKNKMFSMLALLMAATTGAWAQEPEYIDLTTTDYKTWTLDAMPEYAVGLIVEYETELALADAGDNTTKVGEWNECEANVTLTGRTLYKDGKWNTLCLPFGLSAEEIAASDLAGATIKELSTSGTSFNAGTGMLTLAFTTATSIEAGKPYIVKWTDSDGTVSNPVFTGVTITSTTPADNITSSDGAVTFLGTYSPVHLPKDVTTNLYMGAANKLYYPNVDDFCVNAFRAYFQLDPGAGVKGFVMDFGEDDPDSIHNSQFIIHNEDSGWYDIGGRKLDGKPSKEGIYIHNGKKILK